MVQGINAGKGAAGEFEAATIAYGMSTLIFYPLKPA